MIAQNLSGADSRQQVLYSWANMQLNTKSSEWEPLSGDAGARRYFRLQHAQQTYLAVDSPVDKVDNARFIAITQGLRAAGLHSPTVFAAELTAGFLLVDELSRQMYSDVLTAENADSLYTDALQALLKLQTSQVHYTIPILPWVEQEYYAEMTDMNRWLLERHLQIAVTRTQEKALEHLYKRLIQNMHAQPQVCVHRDYHARNLLYCAEHNPGIIDFQDMFIGPITYDLVSLVQDAYVAWPWEMVQRWIQYFYSLVVEQAQHRHMDEEQFYTWFHGMNLQRGVKVLGRFPRLCYRDNKPRYLADLPQVARNTLASCAYFTDSAVLEDLLYEQIMPKLGGVTNPLAGETCAP